MGKKGWKDKQGWWNTKLNVLACYLRRCSVLSPWDWRLQEYTALLVGQTGLSVGTHPSWTTRKVTVARYSITGNVITNWEHWNPLHQILLHGMYHQGSNWNWIVSQHLEKRWWPCLQQVMEGYFHCINEWRKVPCEDAAQHYSLWQDHMNPLCLFPLSPQLASSDSTY